MGEKSQPRGTSALGRTLRKCAAHRTSLTERDVIEIVRREVAELAFEQVKECTQHWHAEWPLALILREMFRVLGVRASTRWGRSAELRKWEKEG